MTVHLARKWRSKNFNELVGQELSVRLLKNSLFKKSFFPAYLFSGLRGSGKTSMGRIFAAAVNCQQLEAFAKDPQSTVVPCGACISCKALFAGQHPDFIEIDAASHTGVDNMRLIIESASLLPTLAHKKIYLIDEAHMLSKAAFNAALKILEEPPVHVIFILATTDPEKIIETIKSRCFQVFFDPIPTTQLAGHLQAICDAEHIAYDQKGLLVLAEQSGGSARDALTTLERIVLSEGAVTERLVQGALGLVQKEVIEELFKALQAQDNSQLLTFLQNSSVLSYSPQVVWRVLTDYIRARLYEQKNSKDQKVYDALLTLLRISYETEPLLYKTSTPRSVVEYMLLRMCNPTPQAESVRTVAPVIKQEVNTIVKSEPVKPAAIAPWQKFIERIKTEVEPLVLTLFSSAVVDYDAATQRCKVNCLKEHELFKEWLDRSVAVWKPLLHEAFSGPVELDINFMLAKDASGQQREKQAPKASAPVFEKRATAAPAQAALKPSENVSKALKIFPGTIQEVK
jgi:DNA polymerase-3 subunit gamma/tau